MSNPSSGSSRTVFVVDDDASVRTALERLLRGAGWTVTTFRSAEELLDSAIDLAVGCVVADVHLGRMSGLELKIALDSRAASVPVILTSGVDDSALEIEARRVGAIAFFRKPFDVGALLDLVRDSIERSEHRMQNAECRMQNAECKVRDANGTTSRCDLEQRLPSPF